MSVRPPLIPRSALFLLVLLLSPWTGPRAWAAHLFVDCSAAVAGNGSQDSPWNGLEVVSSRTFEPGDVIALRRGTACHGSLSLHGSGTPATRIRLTAWGEGARPKIVAGRGATEAVLLKNGAYWQIDSLDIAGGTIYGLLVTGDQDQVQSHITLRNLVVHDVYGGELHNKDNGLVVFLRGSKGQRFDHVLIENVVAAHTNQWAGIMMGAGNFYSEEEGYNQDAVIRNSVAHDVYGDGIILFRVRQGLIDSSTAWLTGQQPTESVGTPNAIWTWSCTDCVVRNNESFLTESPGVDGGAYDIDWATTRNTVEDNYAHDTQGYCVAVFGAGYVTHDAAVRNNVCVDNGLSPRMARLQGAIYLHTWNDGKIDGLTIEKNFIDWNPPAPGAAVVDEKGTELTGNPVTVRENVIRSTSPLLVRSFSDRLVFAKNHYDYAGREEPAWTEQGKARHALDALQASGAEKGSVLSRGRDQHSAMGTGPGFDAGFLKNLVGLDGRPLPAANAAQARLITRLDLRLDADGLIDPAVMARLSVLRTLAREYNHQQLQIVVLVPETGMNAALRNALLDFDTPSIWFARAPATIGAMATTLLDGHDRVAAQWPASASFHAATVGYAVRRELGVPLYAQMDERP